MPEKLTNITENSVSIIIVTWNSTDEIETCIRSIDSSGIKCDYEIIVVDNGSSDNTVAILDKLQPEISGLNLKLVNQNMGYTWACNEGIKSSIYNNILLLNPDTQIIGDAIDTLLNKLVSSDSYGAIAPQLLNDDGSIQKSVRKFPRNIDMLYEVSLLSTLFPKSKTFARWKMSYFNHNETTEVDQPMAAALMIKRKVLDEVNNMDPVFKMFFNDVDLCKKIVDKGYNILFFPEGKIRHSKGVSIYKDRSNMIRVWTGDALKYLQKHEPSSLLYPFVFLGLKFTGFLRILYYKFTSSKRK